MNRSSNKPAIDIINKVLDACYNHRPYEHFIMSLMHQYEERGSLSKKQLQGLYQKALKVKDIPPNWLATLEATILKMHTRTKSPVTIDAALPVKDETISRLIDAILEKYPQHKRLLFLRSKYSSNEALTPVEINEVQKFYKLLISKS